MSNTMKRVLQNGTSEEAQALEELLTQQLLTFFDTTFIGCFVAFVYGLLAVLIVTRLGLYKSYPACALKWTVYIELFVSLCWGVVNKIYNESNGSIGLVWSCELLRFSFTFGAIAVISCGTLCARAFSSAVRTNSLMQSDKKSFLEKQNYVIALIVFVATVPAILSAVYVEKVGLGCNDNNLAYLYIQTGLILILFLLQVGYIIRAMTGVSQLNKTNKQGASFSNSVSNKAIKRLKYKFLIILATLFISWFPLSIQELYERSLNISIFDNWILVLALHGLYVSPIIDSTLLLWHPNVFYLLSGGRFGEKSQASHTATNNKTFKSDGLTNDEVTNSMNSIL